VESILHHFKSKTTATNVMQLVARQPGNGGKACFRVDECPESSTPKNRVYRILFLPAVFREIFPGFVVPNADIMAGWIRGYLYAQRPQQ
jgi:hypothetical protein